VDSKDYFDENPKQDPAKRRSVVPRAFEADVTRACMYEAVQKYTSTPEDTQKVRQWLSPMKAAFASVV
jgi:hypothetical protein